MKAYRISGTEIGSILGLNPWQSPMDLYMRKLGLIDREPENEAMKWGIAAEHVVARRYARETKAKLYPGIDEGFDYSNPLVHPEYPWWTGTPDRQINSGPEVGLLEVKIVGERMATQWGEAPAGDVPEQYLTQVAWYLPLINAEWADLAVQIGNRDYRVYRINRDRELEDQLRDAALAFIQNHLEPQIPPAIDGSESSKRYLNYKYPADQGPILETTDNGILLEIEGRRTAKAALKTWEERVSAYENTIKAYIGEAAGIKGEWGKVTWTKNKDGQSLDYKAMAAAHPDVAAQFMKFKPGARVFRVNLKEA